MPPVRYNNKSFFGVCNMNAIETMKSVIMTPMQLADNASFASNTYVDTAGWSHLRVEFHVGAIDIGVGSGGAANALKLEECDTVGGSYTDITDAALADAIAADEDDKIFAIDVDLRKSHKRYVRVNDPQAGDGSTGAYMYVVGRLSNPQAALLTAAAQGLEEWIRA